MEMKENVMDLQNAIYENNKVLEALLTGHYIKLYKGDEKIIQDIIIDNKQCITMSNFLIKTVNNTLQIFEWVISNNLNTLMKKLTSLAVILSMPLIVTSIYGMNIPLPLQKSSYALPVIMLFSLFLAVVVAFYFRHKDWI
jgi:magnesium transporter